MVIKSNVLVVIRVVQTGLKVVIFAVIYGNQRGPVVVIPAVNNGDERQQLAKISTNITTGIINITYVISGEK